ncbi:putative SH3-domain protein Cyk3 [Fusarium austroafricanum]|uniref:Putative SH3-domain protein Cyk3 n=1 Tax=Fusarium austroafricanum TaxID=2364996 RepID=A0A8H4NVF6_9HYPO|nr:putative SH3-domain protein Cyk3 [Fusarium austroafricanum]
MAPAAPPLPTKFPCWCRAVYSWGGESKRDLGFIEGELIECLNAGDGSWWVGRLYRDRRTVGSFPSNFVELLPSQFRPTTKSVPAPVPNAPPSTAPTKSRTFRKPFEAYAKAPHYTSAKQPEIFKETLKPKKRQNSGASFAPSIHETERGPSPAPPQSYNHRAPSPAPPQAYDHRAPSPAPSHHHGSRAPSPAPMHNYHSRGPSPAPMQNYHHSRAPSPAPPHGYDARGPSPAPPMHQGYSSVSRGPSPAPSFHHQMVVPYRGGQDRGNSPPPPPPPPHRQMTRGGSNDLHRRSVDISRHGSNASFNPFSPSRQNSNNSYRPQQPPPPTIRHGSRGSFDDRSYTPYTPGRNSPVPPSPAGGMTPSPLREAMDGVMEQLDVLGGGFGRGGQAPSPSPPADPWSPESFDMLSHQSNRRIQERSRPKTSMGIAQDEGYETYSGESSQEISYQSGGREDKLSSYVDRMEKRFQQMHRQNSRTGDPDDDQPPPPPPKNVPYERPKSSMGRSIEPERKLRARKSAYEIGRGVARTLTTKTNSTNSSSGNQSNTSASTQSTSRTLWSGTSAGAFSTTSAGSLARSGKRERAQSALGARELEIDRPDSPFTGVTYHSSHASDSPAQQRPQTQAGFHDDPSLELGGLVQPKPPKRNIFRKIFDTAKTGVASSRGGLVAGGLGMDSPKSPFARSMPAGASPMTGMGSTPANRDVATEMGLGGGVDWVQVRRDVNRSNSLSTIELTERRERCQMMDHPALNPVDELYEGVEGDEGADGEPVMEPTNYQAINLSQVDKNSRFISGLPPAITAIQLATTYVCRPYRSEVQRLRAIFTWVSEKICWEEDFEGEIDTSRVIQAKRASVEEYAVLVMEMCAAIGIHCEIVRGYLKSPGEVSEINIMPRPNHWWNAVLVDNEWRMIDCCLASPSYPRRGLYSSANNTADPWWFLTRPLEICWTHIPEHHSQQHIVPPVAHETLLNLPCACAPFFRHGFEMVDYNTALTRIEDLEMVHIKFSVPCDVEIAAEVEVRGYSRDSDGDVFESGEIVKKRALAQAEWFNGIKRYTVKALLPGDEGQGTLKIYAGKRGLMHSIKDIPHPMAFALPIVHTGENPPYEFVTRHPTPHAQRHDIYVVQPQCQRLALNNTFVFAIRQHPSSLGGSVLTPSSNPGGTSPIPFARPGSALSMNASSVSGSTPSSATGTVAGKKPAKLAIQTPGGKILRLMRKEDRKGIHVGGRSRSGSETASDGGTWETIIKCSEKGVWRGLVLADRTARWCVFAEWALPKVMLVRPSSHTNSTNHNALHHDSVALVSPAHDPNLTQSNSPIPKTGSGRFKTIRVLVNCATNPYVLQPRRNEPPYHGHGQGQQGSQQPLPVPGMNPPSSYVPGGYQQYTSPQQQQQQQYYAMPQQQGQQSYLQQQQIPQYGGMQTAYQGYDTAGQTFGGHQLQPAAAQYTPPANVWQQQQQATGGQNIMYQQQYQQPHHQQQPQQMYQRHVASPQQHVQQRRQSGHLPSPQQRPSSIPQNQGYQIPHQHQHQQYPHQQYQQQQQRTHYQQQAQATVTQPSPQPTQKQMSSPAVSQVRQTEQNQLPRQDFSKSQRETIRQPAQKPIPVDIDEPASEIIVQPTPEPIQQQPVARLDPEQMVYVNLQDIQKLPPRPPVAMGQTQSSAASQSEKTKSWESQYAADTVKPMDIMLGSPQTRPLPPPHPKVQTSYQQPAQPQPQNTTPRVKPSPLSSVTNSPAISARSPSITKKSPASTPKNRPLDTVHIMVAVAEECFDKARGSVHDIAMSLNATRIDEYQKLISTGLACLEACLQSNRLSPRQEAKMRLRYATILLEETENSMEAETAITKGISVCEKNGLADLKYCMHYIRLKLLFQRNHKAALNAADRQIADCETYKHPHWVYAFRLLKVSFYMELGQTADASALENIRSMQATASSRGDNALSVFAFILEGLTLLKASKDGNIEKVQACIAQVAKYQLDPSVHIMQLDILTLLLDLVSSINHSGLELTLQKLKLVQDRMDACTDWHSVKSDFLIPVKKQPSTGHTISSDTAGIVQSGEGGPVDFLVMSFMTKVELTSLTFTLTGLVNMHKSSPHGRRTAEFLQEGVKVLDTWDKTTAGFRYGPSISLQDAIAQREWRLEAQCYLTILLGLYAASHCQWDSVKQCIEKLQDIMIPSTQGILRLLAVYLSGVFDQGTGELDAAMNTFQSPAFDLNQRGTGVKAAHRELAMLAGLNRLWIMQHASYRDDRATLELIEQLRPLCLNHYNVDLRTAWHNVMAAVSTDPPQQLNQQKQHIQSAMAGSKSTNNVLGAAVTLSIMRSRLFENVIGEQALKSAMAAAKQAQRSGNILWQSVADGMLAQSFEVQGQQAQAAQEWDKATREAQEAFAGNF